MIADRTVIRRVPTVEASDVGDQVIIRDPELGYLELNPIGSEIWDAVITPINLGSLVILLADTFGVSAAQVRQDIVPFLETLASRGFVTLT